MKKLLPVLLVLFCYSSNAQITIYQQDLPQPGDTFMLYVDKTPTVSLGSPSASSQIWNYSTLANDSTKYATYGITANLPFASSFAASNSYTYGPAILYGGPGAPSPGAGIGYTMWAVNSTGMWVVGHRSDYDGQGEKNIFINPMEMLMPVPCTYPFSQTYDSKWEVTIGYVPLNFDTLYRSRTHKTITCDAWGSMTTPFGSFSNVIRIHEYSVTTDSAFAFIGATTYYSMLIKKDTINKYLFWAPNERHPVAIAYCNNSGVLQRIEYVSWANLNVSEVANNEPSVSVFPNPVSDYITIKVSDNFKNKNYTLRIFDVSGKELYNKICKSDENAISVKGFDKGFYFTEILTEQGKFIKTKFIVN
jgi:hypothetical protein